MPVVDHQRKFKNAGRSDELRRRRAEGSVELRKTRKDEHLMKRRNIDDGDDSTNDETSDVGELAASPDVASKIRAASKPILPLTECMRIFRDDQSRILEAVESIRRSLSRQSNPAVDEVIRCGALLYLVAALDKEDPKIQFEAAWALTNISSGTSSQTRQVVSLGAVPKLVRLLDSGELFVAEQACWALSNISGDCAELRDLVIGHNILAAILRLCTKPISAAFIRTISWSVSNLCRNKNPMPPEEAVSQILPIVSELLDYKDQQVRSDACWAVAYLSDATDERITVIINQGIVQKMVRYLNYDEPSLIAPALRCLGNIVTGDDTHTQAVIDSGVLSAISGAIERGNKNVITKEAMWLLSNIVAGNQEQIQAVLDADLIPIVIKIVKEGDPKSQYEACWVVANLSTGGSLEQVSYVLEKCHDPLFYALSEMLKARESKSLCLALDTTHHLLTSSQKADMLEKSLVTIEECGGLDKIETLQSHTNEDIYHKALNLIEQFFNDSEEEAAGTSQVQAQTEFSFSPPQDPSMGFKF